MLDKTVAILMAMVLSVMSVPVMAISAFADEAGTSWDKAALAEGSSLSLTSTDESLWSSPTDSDRTYAQGSVGSTATVSVSGSGWLIFDWKMDPGTSGNWSDKGTVAVDDAEASYSDTIGANSSTDTDWATKVVTVGAGDHSVTWSYATNDNNSGHDAKICLDNVRFVTSKTAVSATSDANTTVSITSDGSEVTEVAPGSSVTFSATPASGYVIDGWKTDSDASEYLTQSSTYTVTVYDTAASYYASSSKPWSGSGTETDPYQISKVDDLKALASKVSAGTTFEGIYFQQTGYISAGSLEQSIGTSSSSSAFSGTYLGNGKTISGLTVPLFTRINAAGTVSNLKISSSTVKGEDNVGIIAGTNYGKISSVTTSFCSVEATGSKVGGLVGELGGEGSIADCDVGIYHITSASDDNVGTNVGGIAGTSSYNTTISDCVVSAYYVNDDDGIGGEGASTVGGIVGSLASSNAVVKNCVANVDVSGKNRIGGIVGSVTSESTLSNCEYNGNVGGTDAVGGIVGYIDGSSYSTPTVSNNIATGTVAAGADTGNAGGIAGTATKACTVSGNAALQYSVDAKTAHRIAVTEAASWGGTPTYSDNYAYASLLLNDAATTSTDATSEDGSDLSVDALLGTTVPAPFSSYDSTSWTTAAGTMPKLSGDVASGECKDYPDYIGAVSDDFNAAFKDPSTLSGTTKTATKWHKMTDDGTYAAGDAGAQGSVTVKGSGWLIFEWRLKDQTNWQDGVDTTMDGSNSGMPSLSGGSSDATEWATKVIPVSEGTHTFAWSVDQSTSGNQVFLRNVRFTSSKTSLVEPESNGNVSVSMTVDGEVATEVEPNTEVVYTATADPGYVVAGFKTSADATEYLATGTSYTTTVYDEAPSLYVETQQADFSDGTGTESDPYQIASADDLTKLDEYVNAGTDFSGQYFKLTSDIALDENFKGIGSGNVDSGYGTAFCGTFDGDSHTISGIAAPRGLFPNLGSGDNQATVENLTISGKISTDKANAGILAGYAHATISNVSVSGSITSSYTKSYGGAQVGGIVGALSDGSITGCTADVDVTVSDFENNIDGAVGGICGESMGTVTKCAWKGSISAPKASLVGGIVGELTGTGNITECYADGSVSGLNGIGGIAGSFEGYSLANCAFDGTVTAPGKNAGGIFGSSESGSQRVIESCYATGTVAAGSDSEPGVAGGIGGYTDDALVVKNCVALQQSISTNSGTASRIIGQADKSWSGETVELSGNSAYSGMSVNNATVSDGIGADTVQGASVMAKDLLSATESPAAYKDWQSDAWTVEAGKSPILKSVAAERQNGYPDYLSPIDLSKAQVVVDDPDGYTYQAGKQVVPTLTVGVGDVEISSGLYTVSYALKSNGSAVDAPVDAGVYVVTVSAAEGADCINSTSIDFTVTPADIVDATVSTIDAQTYTGSAIEPEVTVTYGEGDDAVVLKEDTDYTVSYKDNTNAGTATVTVTGTGNYTGTLTSEFEITTNAEDKKAADEATAAIEALPSSDKVSVSDEDEIAKAQGMYDSLTDTQKTLVPESALSKLKQAQEALNKAKSAASSAAKSALKKGSYFTVKTAAGTFRYRVTGNKKV
ncbi:MAG: beta strand repeat-containing protein [Coriobacteriales bacterium]